MPITYPLSLPVVAGVGYDRWEVAVRDVVSASASPFTGSQQIYDFGAGWWELRIRTTPLFGRSQADPWIAFLRSLRGKVGTFLAGDPLRTALTGAGGGTPVVNGSNAVRARTLAVRGLPNSITNVWRAGDLIQLGSGATARLHIVLTDTSSNGSGQATVDIAPPLRTTYADGAAIVVSNPVGVFRLTDNAIGYAIEPSVQHQGLALPAVEAL
jgi:hypothetical protein